MAFPNGLYDKGVLALRTSAIDWVIDPFKLAFVRTAGDLPLYVPDLAVDEFLSDIPVGAVTRQTDGITGKTKTSIALGVDVYDADDLEVDNVVGPAFQSVVLYQDTGVAATSRLLAFWGSATGLPFTPLAGNVTVEWPFDANKIFKLGPIAARRGFFARAGHMGIGNLTASAGYGSEQEQVAAVLGVPWLNRKADNVGGQSEKEHDRRPILEIIEDPPFCPPPQKPKRKRQPRPWLTSTTISGDYGRIRRPTFTWEEEREILRVAGTSLTASNLAVGALALVLGVGVGYVIATRSGNSRRGR